MTREEQYLTDRGWTRTAPGTAWWLDPYPAPRRGGRNGCDEYLVPEAVTLQRGRDAFAAEELERQAVWYAEQMALAANGHGDTARAIEMTWREARRNLNVRAAELRAPTTVSEEPTT